MSAISIQAVSKSFSTRSGERVALDSVSLEIPSGSFTCIVGASGCGKSTLLNMVGGLDVPSSGRIEVAGKPVAGPGPERGMVFQSYALYPWLRVRQNVEFGLRMTGRPKSTWRQISDELLGEMGLSDFADAFPRELSGGMRQRVAIARALATDPPVMLMDEPFGALDALTRISAQRLLLEVWQRHRRTIVFVTHDINEALLLGDQIAVLSSSPGQLKELIPINFDRPRTAEVASTAEFTKLRDDVLAMIFDTPTAPPQQPDSRREPT